MANPQSQYYPTRPGGPYLGGASPRVRHDNFETEKVIEDRIRNKTEYQGANEQEMWGYIQDEINYARTNAIGLYAYNNGRVNKFADDGAPGR